MATTIVCHPFDTVRTRLQAASPGRFEGVVSCVTQTIRREGMMGLYKGMAFPLGAQAVYKAVIFTVNGYAKRAFATKGFSDTSLGIFSCGALSGTINSFIVTPVELVRNRLMLQYQKGPGTFEGPMECMKHILHHRGVFGMWQGLWPTMMRDGVGMGIYFLSFETTKRGLMLLQSRQAGKELTTPQGYGTVLLAGSAAGISFWAVALPFDASKTVIQATKLERGQPSPRLWKTMKGLVQEGGVSCLFRGWPVAIGRGIPGAAVTMATYGRVKQAMS
ncbi:unnamed protein product [Choristocarpus tenellus]